MMWPMLYPEAALKTDRKHCARCSPCALSHHRCQASPHAQLGTQ
jgi:hypothetical protein